MMKEKKPRSTYNPLLLSEKLNISLDEAEKIVVERKFKTSGSLKAFIFRYGEIEGKLKYDEFCKKSAHTLESYIKKYGEAGEEKYEKYLKTKDSRSDKFFQKKYGENWEYYRDIFIDAWKHKLTLKGYIEKYGEIEGVLLYNKMNSKKIHSLESFILKYGKDGEEKYINYGLSKDSMSLDFHIKKYGEIEGRIELEKRKMYVSPVFKELVKLLGEVSAIQRYKNYILDKTSDEFCVGVAKKVSEKWFKSPKQKVNVSKSSQILFELLQNKLDTEIKFGSKKQELKLFDDINCKNYYYDAFIPKFNIIIEYNGSAFHYHETFDDNWMSLYGVTKEQSVRFDNQKNRFAESFGYKVITVWDFETNSKNKIKTKLEEIVHECEQRVV